jgi:hypothetical protein
MDCKDLMVGDWVYIHEPECKGHRIDAIDELDGQVGADGEVYDECDIRPIPLTEEILAKNGFTYEEDTFLPDTGYWSLSNEDGLLYFTINAFGVKGSGEVAFGYQDIALKYVHQLQNLLVIAGVEKEIEL